MDIPNAITGSRFVLAAIGCVFLLIPFPFHHLAAGVVFAVAVFSDWLDGLLARRMKRFSPLGTFLDPLADKILVLEYMLYLTMLGLYPLWLLMAVLARDVLHDAFRNFGASRKITLPANVFGKAKTALQMTSVILLLVLLALEELGKGLNWTADLRSAGAVLMILALASGLAGAFQSALKHRSLFLGSE